MSRTAEQIFHEARALPPSEQAAYLKGACGDDTALRAEVEALLKADAEAGRFLRTSDQSSPTTDAGAAGAATMNAPAAESQGARIGVYKLLHQIGEGGFGAVFLAEQQSPMIRKVALKIIKLGMDTRQVVARFEAERQALAMMDHPHIARVFDAGATASGRPYFVMELVTGKPITDYCDANNLQIEQRLEVFAQVCHAVQHAHQKGVVHRDIKPSNVLVSTQDGRPLAKVIDFGIAKATAARLTEKTLFTEHRQLIGTPEYMSPEQAEGSLDIDTRTDVYSLGVLLYELLTGATPFDSESLRSAAYGEIQRIIREVDPPKPSTRLSQSPDTLAAVAAHRRTEPRKLGSMIRGDLDWIVMKALEKDRARRYETANGLANDIGRFLAGDAVVAAPPSAAYRMKKFVRRHKRIVLSGAAVTAALLIGVIGFAWQATIAQDQRDRAQEERNRAVIAETEAKARTSELKQVSDFQAHMLAQVNPSEAGRLLTVDVLARFEAALTRAGVPEAGGERAAQVEAFTTQWNRVNATDAARELIDRTILRPAVLAIDSQFADQPVVDSTLRHVLAVLYRILGLYDAAQPLQEQALAIRRRALGEEHPDTLVSLNDLGMLFQTQGRLGEAEPYYREALDKCRRVHGVDHHDTITALNNLGTLLHQQGKMREAEPLCREALEARRRVLGDEHPDTLISLLNVGALLYVQGKMDAAEPYYREALEMSRRIRGDDHVDTVYSLNNLATVLRAQERLDAAEPYAREALAMSRRVLGEEHPATLVALNNLGLLLQSQGHAGEAEPYLRDSLQMFRRALGETHADTLAATINLASLLVTQGKHADAVALLVPIEPTARATFVGSNAGRLASLLMLVGKSRLRSGEFAQAEASLIEAHAIDVRIFGESHDVASECARSALVNLYTAWDSAEPGKGYDAKAAEWKAKLDAEQPPATSPATSQPAPTTPATTTHPATNQS